MKNTWSEVYFSTKLQIEGLKLDHKSTPVSIFNEFHSNLWCFNIFRLFRNIFFLGNFLAATPNRWIGFQKINFHKSIIHFFLYKNTLYKNIEAQIGSLLFNNGVQFVGLTPCPIKLKVIFSIRALHLWIYKNLFMLCTFWDFDFSSVKRYIAAFKNSNIYLVKHSVAF